MSYQKKILLLIIIIAITLGYSFHYRNKFISYESRNQELILKELPDFFVEDLNTAKSISSKKLLEESEKGLIIHFWGTWCAPCEVEFPSLIQFATKMEKRGVQVAAIAVNDDSVNVQKFIKKKIVALPSNLKIYLDTSGKLLSQFGTMKVPESFLFNKLGQSLRRYIGPKDWNLEHFSQDVVKSLNIK